MGEPHSPEGFHVSEKARKRVKNPLPAPCECRYCGAAIRLTGNDEVYNGRRYGDWPFVYLCQNPGCGAYVGVHPGTDIPLGILADAALRNARKREKPHFERLWRGKDARFTTRSEAYRWLAEKLGIPLGECHWGWFDTAQCALAGEICRKEQQHGPMAQALRAAGIG